MRLLIKLAMKLVVMGLIVVLLGGGLRYGRRYIMKAAGAPEGQFSSEESDLMATVFKSALRLFSGNAKRDELAGELSNKLYAGRDTATMSELGIELVKPNGTPASTPDSASTPAPAGAASAANSQSSAKAPAKKASAVDEPAADDLEILKPRQTALLARSWTRAKAYGVELSLVPVVFFGMVVVQRYRGRSKKDEFMLPPGTIQTPAESEAYDMKHDVHSLGAEDFEMLVGLIYQRQGYRVSMPAGHRGGRGGDFILMRKSEKILVRCRRLSQEQRVPVDRVRELHEAMSAANLTRGMYVVSSGFSWDARNFAKAKGMTLINARTLDQLIDAARERPDENLLAVPDWAPKFMSKVQLTTPNCPSCEAAMEQVNDSVWLCSQRPDCRGRLSSRKYQKPSRATAPATETPAGGGESKSNATADEVKKSADAPVDRVRRNAAPPVDGVKRKADAPVEGGRRSAAPPADGVKRKTDVPVDGAKTVPGARLENPATSRPAAVPSKESEIEKARKKAENFMRARAGARSNV